MVHPLVRLVASRPHLLAEHAYAYADLLTEELSASAAQLKRQLVFHVIGACSFSSAAILAGVATLLWAALPANSLQIPWLLVFVPIVPAAVGVWALNAGGAVAPGDPLAVMRRQLSADAAMLHNASLAGES